MMTVSHYKTPLRSGSPCNWLSGTKAKARLSWLFIFEEQITNCHYMFAKKKRVIMSCPRWLRQVLYDCTCTLFKLLLLAGDTEANPGPLSDSATRELVSVMKELQYEQTAILNEPKWIRLTVSYHEISLNELKTRLEKNWIRLPIVQHFKIRDAKPSVGL